MKMNKVDTINLLQHDDKWHLGRWEHILCAPTFTSWLHIPGMMPATITILFSLFLPSQFLMSKVTMFVLGWTPRFGVQILNSTTLASATHGGLLN